MENSVPLRLYFYILAEWHGQTACVTCGKDKDMTRDAKVYAFYKSRTWKKVSKEYVKRVGGLCERCYQHGKIVTGEIVHHRVHVTAETIEDASITLNPDNLELVCRSCHAKEHPEMYGHDERRYKVIDGRIIVTGD